MLLFKGKTVLFVLFSTLLFASCTKITNSEIGGDLIPPADGVNTEDVLLDVDAKNTNFDTIGVNLSDDHSLGYIATDPIFGTTDASVAVQLKPTTFSTSSTSIFEVSPDSTFLDSVVLVLKVNGFWGDSAKQLSLHVHSMDLEETFTQSALYSNVKTFEKAEELTENGIGKSVVPRDINDSGRLQREGGYINQVRIRLSSSFGEKLLHTFASSNSNAYYSDSLFDVNFRGLIVSADANGETLLRIGLVDTSTKLALYYRYTSRTAGESDTTVRYYKTNSSTSASANTILHNRTGAEIAPYFPTNSAPEDDLIFMQTGPGTKARIHINGLETFSNVLVHRAELLMEQVPDEKDNVLTPPNLFLQAINDTGRVFAIPNDIVFSNGSITNLATFGVAPKTKSGGVTFYSFDVTRYVQGIVTRADTAYDMILSAPYYNYIYSTADATGLSFISTSPLNYAGVGRVRLGGGSNTLHPMQLHIIYSKL